jgi:uroporphyrin-III C-methyltransferase
MTRAQSGVVYLVGAGPGDPELLTLRAVRLLESADVVLHDDLVPDELLALVHRHALVTSVGKRCGRPRITQAGIHKLMIESARARQSVVRLKSGDPLVFGRAGEEIAALRAAGIAFEVVPGVTAAFAAGAALSLLHRSPCDGQR